MRSLRSCSIIALLLLAASCGPKRQPVPLYYSAESSLRRGDLREAVNAYRLFLNDPGPEGRPYVPRSYYMLALSYYRLGEYDNTLATLDELEEVDPKNDWVQVWALRGDANKALGEHVNAVQDWDEAWRQATAMDRQRLQRRIESTLTLMSLQELEQAETVVKEPAVHDAVAKQLVAAGGSLIPDSDEIGAAPAEPLAPPPPSRATGKKRAAVPPAEMAAVEPAAPAPRIATPVLGPVPAEDRKVACLVPLSGSNRAEGERILASVRLAFGDEAERVVEYDAGGSSESARMAWNEIVSNPDTYGVITRLDDEAATLIADLAARSRLPIISLSEREGLEGAYVRPWGLSRNEEVGKLVDYMVNTVRVRTFAALYPATPSGEAYLEAFRAAVQRSGAKLAGSRSYDRGQTDWSGEIDQIRKWRGRDINVGAIFVPDDIAEAEPLAATINSKFGDVILLGISSWNGAPQTAQLRAFVVDTLSGPTADLVPRDFADRFASVTGEEPGSTEAEAYEAGKAMLAAVTEEDTKTRADVRLRLATTAKASSNDRPPVVLLLHDGRVDPASAPAG